MALRNNARALQDAGYYYPLSGTLRPRWDEVKNPDDAGHHLFAWLLVGDRRFTKGDRHFTKDVFHIDTLINEIKELDHDIIISSEEFEGILRDGEFLDFICCLSEKVKKKLCVVIYIRNQIDYCESLYTQILREPKEVYGKTFCRHVDDILQNGVLQFQDILFQFDYNKVINELVKWDRFDLIVKNYHALESESIVTDFASVLGVSGPLAAGVERGRINRRDSIEVALANFYANRVGRRANLGESARIRYLASRLANPRMSVETQRRFIARFAEGNRQICRRLGLDPRGLDMAGTPRPGEGPTLEEVFSFETQCLIADGRFPHEPRRVTAGMRAWAEGVESVPERLTRRERFEYRMRYPRRIARWYRYRAESLLRDLLRTG